MKLCLPLLYSRRVLQVIFLFSVIACLAGVAAAQEAQSAQFSGAVRISAGPDAEASRKALAAGTGMSALPADIQTTHGDFGPVNVGASSASPVAMVFTFDASVTLGSTAVLTQGAAGLDFTDAGSGSCKANKAYNAGNTCTIKVTFAPRFPGTRYGAAELLDASGGLLALGYIQGTGVGPLAIIANETSGIYLPSKQISLGSGFYSPFGLALDGSGNVFIADRADNEVKEILAKGGYTTVKTLGSGFSIPSGVAVDGAGNVFVADSNNHAVKEMVALNGTIPSSPTIKTLGSGFNDPNDVSVDGSGNVFVSDWSNSAVYEVLAAGGYTTVKTLGHGFYRPIGVAVDGSGNVFVGDWGNSAVYEVLAAGGYTTVKALGSGFYRAHGVAVDGSGNVYVTDEGNSAVKEILAAGGYITVKTLATGYQIPAGIKVDGSGNLFVAQNWTNAVTELDYADPPSLDFGDEPVGSASNQQTYAVSNIGNADLKFPVPGAGDNPSLEGTEFSIDAGSTCPEVSNTDPAPGKLAMGTSCVYSVDFSFDEEGPSSGSLTLTDNSLNASPNATQTISMTGTAFGDIDHLAFTMPPTSPMEAGGTPSVTLSDVDATGDVFYGLSFTASLKVTGPKGYAKWYSASTQTGVVTFNNLAALTAPGTYTYAAHEMPENLTAPPVIQIVTAAQASYTAPDTNVGSASPTQTATIEFAASGTLNTIEVLTQGAVNLDFKAASGGTCAIGMAYTARQTCTVSYIFDPLHPGLRIGAIRLSDAGANVLATGYISGTGVGPLAVFANTTTGNYASSKRTILADGFSYITGIALDASGDVFIADAGDDFVKEVVAVNGSIPASPTIKTLANGYRQPYGVAVDGAGNVFFGDRGNDTVDEIVAMGGYTTVKILAHGIGGPNGIAVDASGNIFVADWSNAVKEIVAAGGYTTVKTIGSGFQQVANVAVDGNDNVFVADYGSGRGVYELLAADGYSTVKTLAGGMTNICSVAMDASGNLYITQLFANGAVYEVLASGGYTTVKTIGSGFNGPNNVVVDGSGNVFVTESGLGRLVKLDYADPPSLSFAKTSVGVKSSDSPQTVTVSNNGNADLSFPFPASGDNPSIASGFALDSATTCPLVDTTSSAGKLAAGASCRYAVNFIPVDVGTDSGSLILTDNNLNANPAVTQTIPLTGETIGPHLVFTTPPPAGLPVGQAPGTVAASVEDSSNNVISSSSATVTLTVTGPGSYSKVYTATATSGIATFTSLASPATTGSYTYTATDVPDSLIQAVANESVWTPHLAFTTAPPGSLEVGSGPGSVKVSIEDPNNKAITISSAMVTLTVTGPNSYSKVYAATAASGVAAFTSLTSLAITGTYTYTATDVPDSLTQAVASEAVWTPHLAFTTPPPADLSVAQSPGIVKVSVEDSNNNALTSSSATVKLTVTGPGSYSKVYTATAASGVATFSSLAVLNTAGSYTYTATDVPDGLTPAVANESVTWPPPFGYLVQAVDSVSLSATVGQPDSLKVQGWVADWQDGAPLSNVTVYVDGTSIGKPTMGISRADVAAKYGSAFLNSGFKLVYPAASFSLGKHKVTVVAVDSGGRSTTLGPRTITVVATAASGPPFGTIGEAVDSVTGTTTVSQSHSLKVVGWVADATDGAPLSNVKVEVDGVSIGTPTLGIAHPDVAAKYGNAYLNSGYRMVYPATSLTVGTHKVTVVAVDAGGRSTTFGPLTITVQ
ncbi:MAG TPA: choice-of-anchor D domain-containing protein [Terracidiphilus sp.]|jgi:sugar lactone lactonase YvrE